MDIVEARGEEDLERRLRAGDGTALGELFTTYRQRLWRMVDFRMDHRLRGRVDPDDVLQEGYLAAAQRIEHYRASGPLSPFVWLRMIVGQTLIDIHRHHLGAQLRDAGREVSLNGNGVGQTTSASLAAVLAGHLTSPSQVVARADLLARVEQAIAGMDPVDQEILALRHFEELSNTEVAEVLGIQQKAASIRYVRAVRRLKEILSQVPGFFEEQSHG